MSEKTIWICHNCGADWPSDGEPDHCYRCLKKHEMFNTGYTEKEWNAKNDKEKEEVRGIYYNAKKAKMYATNRKMVAIILAFFAVFTVICLIIIATSSNSSSNYSDISEPEHTCAICGKPATAQLTFDHEWYCSEHYADAWNWYNDKSQGKNVY